MNGEALSREEKEARLGKMAAEIEGLAESPLYDYRREHGFLPVLGEGDPNARLMFIGEAPGKLGQFGLNSEKISQMHGREIEARASYGPVTVVPMYHPEAAF